jgi:hypothetical protein
MSRTEPAQFNVRSSYARKRAREIAEATGMTVTRVVEDALRAYAPPSPATTVGALVRRGPLLVLPAKGGSVSLDEANAALDATRGERP